MRCVLLLSKSLNKSFDTTELKELWSQSPDPSVPSLLSHF